MFKTIIARLEGNRLFHTLIHVKGNPKLCILTEPLWGIPFALYSPFATLYMYALGVDDRQIGFLLTIGMIVQVVAAFFGGIITDKLGRRVTTLLFDVLSWTVYTFILIFAQNFWWFFIGVIINSMWQITNNSWSCLLVEDCEKSLLVDVYTWVQVSGLLSVFFAPISALLLGYFDLVFAVRLLYTFAFVSMTIKFLLLYFIGHETKQGLIRMEETKHVPVRELLKGYTGVFAELIRNRAIVTAISLKLLVNIGVMVTNAFSSLYITQNSGLPEHMLAYLPMIRAALLLLFIFTIQNGINRLPFKLSMSLGAVLYIVSNTALILSADIHLAMLIPYIILDAFAFSFLIMRVDAVVASFISEKERSRMNSIMYIVMIGLTAPFGSIAGNLSDISRRLPFMLNIACYGIMLLIIMFSQDLKRHRD